MAGDGEKDKSKYNKKKWQQKRVFPSAPPRIAEDTTSPTRGLANRLTYSAYVPNIMNSTAPVVPRTYSPMYQSQYGYGYTPPQAVAAPMNTGGFTGQNSGTPMQGYPYTMYSGQGPQYGQPSSYPGYPGEDYVPSPLRSNKRKGEAQRAGVEPPATQSTGQLAPVSWEDRFYAEHGRYPNEEDAEDRMWSEDFARANGRPPTMDEWTWHYYQKYPTSQAGGGGQAATPETLGSLAWWASAEALPANLRGWGSWLREMVEANKGINISNPFFRTGAAGTEAIADVVDSGAPLAGYSTSNDVIARLRELLGIQASAQDNNTTIWQKVINALPSASLEAQQLMNSLRYNSDTNQWYSIDTTQLVNPSYT